MSTRELEPVETDPPADPLAEDLTPQSVLARIAAARDKEEQGAREKLYAAEDWIAIHSRDSLVGPADGWHEKALPLGGEGAPEVAEFAVVELAAALGMSPQAARVFAGDTVELRYRLPQVHARVKAGDLPVWRARMIARATYVLPPDGAAFVDRVLAPVAHKVGPTQLKRLIEKAMLEFDPETAEANRLAAAERRHATLHKRDITADGVVDLTATLDLADGLDLETAIAIGAELLAAHGCTEPLDVRRSKALGLLARGELGLDKGSDAAQRRPARKRRSRELVIYAHVHSDAVQPLGDGIARIENIRTMVAVDQIAEWCADPATQVTIRPVIDLNDVIRTDAYEVPARLAEQVTLRDNTCVFPYCTRPARRADKDHIEPYDEGGETSSDNTAALCRLHHRVKTTGRWRYCMLGPGTYRWTSPHQRRYLKDPTGTVACTDDAEPFLARGLISRASRGSAPALQRRPPDRASPSSPHR